MFHKKEEKTENAGYSEGKKKRKKLPGWVILPVLGVIAAVFFAVSRLTAGEGVVQLSVVSVERGDIRQTYHASGTVESERSKVFYSPVNAPVKTCRAKVGTSVKKGDLLVSFDVTDLEKDNRQSELSVLQARYTSEDAREQSSRAAKAAAEGKAQSVEAKKQVQEQIQDKKKEIASLEKQAGKETSQASKNAAKIASLRKDLEENLDAQSEQQAIKENAERQLSKLDGNKEEYEQQIQELLKKAQEATDQIASLQKASRSLENQLAVLENAGGTGAAEQLAAARKELETLEDSLAQLGMGGGGSSEAGLTSGQEKNLEVTEDLAELSRLSTGELLEKGREGIKAEFDGVISDVKVQEGSTATQGLELFTLVSNQDVKVRLEVPANDYENLIKGSKAQITIGKASYQGSVTSVDKIALTNEKGNAVIHADVTVNNPDEELCIGVGAKAVLTVAEKSDILYLPGEVVNTSAEGDFVYVIRGGQVEKQPVELGIASDSQVEIQSGLKEGDQVISDVSGEVREGMKATGIYKETEGE